MAGDFRKQAESARRSSWPTKRKSSSSARLGTSTGMRPASGPSPAAGPSSRRASPCRWQRAQTSRWHGRREAAEAPQADVAPRALRHAGEEVEVARGIAVARVAPERRQAVEGVGAEVVAAARGRGSGSAVGVAGEAGPGEGEVHPRGAGVVLEGGQREAVAGEGLHGREEQARGDDAVAVDLRRRPRGVEEAGADPPHHALAPRAPVGVGRGERRALRHLVAHAAARVRDHAGGDGAGGADAAGHPVREVAAHHRGVAVGAGGHGGGDPRGGARAPAGWTAKRGPRRWRTPRPRRGPGRRLLRRVRSWKNARCCTPSSRVTTTSRQVPAHSARVFQL